MESPKIQVFWGPNIYSRDAVVVGGVTLDEAMIARSRHIIETVTAITAPWFPCKPNDSCSNDAERLASFIVEWALAALTCQSGFLNARGYRATGPDSFALWLGFHQPRFSSAALSIANSVCKVAATGHIDVENLRRQLEALWKAASPYHPDSQAQIQMEGARAMGLPYMPAWNIVRHWQFGWGANSLITFQAASNQDGVISNQVMSNKRYSKSMIEYIGLPVPKDEAVTQEKDLPATLERIGFPCVVKPPNMADGMGVSAGLTTMDQVRTAFRRARQYTQKPIMIEQHVPGSDHRLMIANKKLVGAFRRDPPMVTGDGASTVRQLIEELNRDRVPKGTNSYTQLVSIDLDESVMQHLGRLGLSADTVVSEGERVTLKSTGNVSAGGTSTDVTTMVHPDVRMAAEMIAQSLDAELAGFDYVTADISKSWRDGHCAFIELNLTPGLNVLTRAGWSPAEVGKMALGSQPGRIPLNCVIVPDSEIELIETFFARANGIDGFGWATHQKAQIGSLPLRIAEREPWAAVNALLGNRALERAVVFIPSSHLQTHGFPVDRADRIWNCDPDLPSEWQDVLNGASSAPVEHVSIEQFLKTAPLTMRKPDGA